MVSIVSYGIYGKNSIAFICICISICYSYHLSYHYIISQWEFQDPKMEVLYHIHMFGHILWGISPYIGLTESIHRSLVSL
jgi:hypothetical protein